MTGGASSSGGGPRRFEVFRIDLVDDCRLTSRVRRMRALPWVEGMVSRWAGWVAALAVVWAMAGGLMAQGVISFNGGFDSGLAGWTAVGGAGVVATGESNDNPFGRVPDGALTFLYQRGSSLAPVFEVSFDYFTGLMNSSFPSPGGFPDTLFATVYFGATAGGLAPEALRSGAAVSLFDFDAANGLGGLLPGAAVRPSPARAGWNRFEGTFDAVLGQPHWAVTFQNLNGNGIAGDSAFLVDNLQLVAIPEPGVFWMLVFGGGWVWAVVRRRGVGPATLSGGRGRGSVEGK
jgi:hypothetical protein